MSNHVGEDFNRYLEHKQSVQQTEKMMKESFLFWPKTYPPIDDMVQSGLNYAGDNDDATCIVCDVTLSDLKKDDDIVKKHSKASPIVI